MFDKIKFELTKQHLKLTREMNISYNEYCEFGAPEVDPKRPYVNSDVYGDIARILDIKPALIKDEEEIYSNEQEDEMLKIHKETAQALQVILASGSFEAGIYEAENYRGNWAKVAD